MNEGAFNSSIKNYLRQAGRSQSELANELGLHPLVVNRKLNGHAKARFTEQEATRAIEILVDWHVITTREDVLQLLKNVDLEATILLDRVWQKLSRPAVAAPVTSSPSQHNLPAPATRLIGRTWTVARIQELLKDDHIHQVTLLGPGGSGKTRISLHVGHLLINDFSHGVWFVTLSGISDPDLVSSTIIQALDIRPTPGLSSLRSLINYLQKKQLLLILDNFEHVAEAKVVVGELLAEVHGLKVLITSRVTLRLPGEHEYHVSPLDVPDLSLTSGRDAIAQYEAVQLFVERAQAVKPTFVLDQKNAITVAQICAKVDGLPLAVELAAARIKVLPPSVLLERLSSARLLVLIGGARNAPDRHQTLSNTITWSYNLLSPDEQTCFRRLGVFNQAWSQTAAEAMMEHALPSGSSVATLLQQLVESNLVVQLPAVAEQPRFTMLETLREYALKQMQEQGELEQMRDWHACYYLNEAEEAELGLRGPQQQTWLARLIADSDNFRAALEWSLSKAKAGLTINGGAAWEQRVAGKPKEVANSDTLSSANSPASELLAVELCQRLAAAFRPCWEWQGNLTDGRYWLNVVLAVPLGEHPTNTMLAARAKTLSEAARLVSLQDEQAQAADLAEQSLKLWRELQDARGLASALIHRGWAAHGAGEYERAWKGYVEGLQVLSPSEDIWLCAQLLFHMGAAAAFNSDYEQMHTCYNQSRELFEMVGDKSSIADTLKDQGGLMLLQSRHREAITYLRKSIQICYELDHKQFMATGLGLLSFAFGLLEEPDPVTASIHSARLRGASDRLMERIGLTPWTRNHPMIQAVTLLIRSRVDEQTWESAWTEGKFLSPEQAVHLVHYLADSLPEVPQA